MCFCVWLDLSFFSVGLCRPAIASLPPLYFLPRAHRCHKKGISGKLDLAKQWAFEQEEAGGEVNFKQGLAFYSSIGILQVRGGGKHVWGKVRGGERPDLVVFSFRFFSAARSGGGEGGGAAIRRVAGPVLLLSQNRLGAVCRVLLRVALFLLVLLNVAVILTVALWRRKSPNARVAFRTECGIKKRKKKNLSNPKRHSCILVLVVCRLQTKSALPDTGVLNFPFFGTKKNNKNKTAAPEQRAYAAAVA